MREGKHIPHNRIHRILLIHNKAKQEPNEQKRRKWVRYEREHSMELWHTDWKQLNDGKWLISYEDDASRKVMSYGVFSEATAELSVRVLIQGMKTHDMPDAVLTDRGTQFYSSEGERKEKGKTVFELFLERRGIEQIVGRVNHPQTNGKIKKFYGLVDRKLPEFKDIDALVEWYNNIKPHRSLRWEWLETPSQAFTRKLPAHRIIGMVDWFE